MARRPRYSSEFKAQAVRMLLEDGRKVCEVRFALPNPDSKAFFLPLEINAYHQISSDIFHSAVNPELGAQTDADSSLWSQSPLDRNGVRQETPRSESGTGALSFGRQKTLSYFVSSLGLSVGFSLPSRFLT